MNLKIYANALTDGSYTYDIVGKTKEGKLTIRLACSEAIAQDLLDRLEERVSGIEMEFTAVI